MTRRLLFLVPDAGYFLGHRLGLAKAARREGWEVEVATAPDPRQRRILELGFTVHSIPFARHRHGLGGALSSFLALLRLYRERRPVLVHHVTLKAVILGGLAGRIARVPAMVHAVTGLGHLYGARELKWRLLRWPVKLALAVATPARARLITEHEADRRRLAWTPGLRARSRVIEGSGVDTDLFAKVPLPPGPLRFLLASRLLRAKGIESYAEAARMRKAQGSEAAFLLAGEPDPGHPDSVSREEIEAWAASGAIEWLGFVEDMPALFASVHAVVLPSRYGEGVPRCLIEAASVGRALVASDLPGCRSIARDGENGLVVPQGDAAALAGALAKLEANSDLLERFGERGRTLVEETFSDARVSAATLALYRELSA